MSVVEGTIPAIGCRLTEGRRGIFLPCGADRARDLRHELLDVRYSLTGRILVQLGLSTLVIAIQNICKSTAVLSNLSILDVYGVAEGLHRVCRVAGGSHVANRPDAHSVELCNSGRCAILRLGAEVQLLVACAGSRIDEQRGRAFCVLQNLDVGT